MKYVFLLAITTISFASCKEGWTDDYKAQYRSQCLQEAGGMYQTKEQVESYCDCNLEAMMKVYPHPSDVLENYDSVAIRKALQDCSLKAQQ